MSLVGKVAIVTGASRGIGAAIALKLAEEGAQVAITYVSPSSAPKAAALITEINALPANPLTPQPRAIGILADLASATAPASIVKQTLSGLQTTHIDILVNNAGIASISPLASITQSDFDAQFAVNTRAPLFLSQAVLPHLPRGGRIINVSSTNARTGMPGTAVYSGSKVALEGFTRVLAAELGTEFGVTVNAVNPGPVETDMYVAAGPKHHAAMAEVVKNVPAGGRMGLPEDVADIVVWLAGEKARWVSGNVVTANGGLVMM